jgi:hypothetical protein
MPLRRHDWFINRRSGMTGMRMNCTEFPSDRNYLCTIGTETGSRLRLKLHHFG